MNRTPHQYIPGQCNIGEAEVRRRLVFGGAALGVTLILIVSAIDKSWPWEQRGLVGIPAFLSALGFLQARAHFCVAYGILGVFNVGPDLQGTDTVQQAEMRKVDRRHAWAILLYSLLAGLAVGGIFAALPLGD